MGRLRQLLIVSLSLMLVSASGVWGQTEKRRVALVIGNSQYQHAASLPNPIKDASAVTKKLREVDFEAWKGSTWIGQRPSRRFDDSLHFSTARTSACSTMPGTACK